MKASTRELLFIYGTLMSGHRANRMMIDTGCTLVEDAMVRGYTLMHLGGFPGMVGHKNGEVVGELWMVPSGAWPHLDAYEGLDHANGPNGLYHRGRVTTAKGQDAHTYIYNGDASSVAEDGGLARWIQK